LLLTWIYLKINMSENLITKTKVQLLGKVYTLKGDVEPDYMLNLAKYVEDKLQELKEITESNDTTKLALLVALNIADEFFQEKNKTKKLPGNLTEEEMSKMQAKTLSLIALLEQGLIGETVEAE